MSFFLLIFFIPGAYLMGSVCSAVIVCKLLQLPDPRHSGSNNPGATNVLRIGGAWAALLVLLADALKGTLPVLTAKILGLPDDLLAWIALAAVLGHMYPLFFAFKGGKGVATALGGLLGLHVLFAGEVIATWLLVAAVTRYSSLASLIAMGLAPLYAYFQLKPSAAMPVAIIALLIWYQHRHNCQRLLNGTESKINAKASGE